MEYTKEIKFIGRNDYAAVVNGAEVGYASTRLAAQRIADEYVAQQIEWDARCEATPAEQPAPVVAPAPRFVPATSAKIAAAVAQAREAAREQARWVNAINRAYQELLTGQWLWDGSRLVIASRTRPGLRHTATATACTCEAYAKGNACYHRASVRLLQRATATA